jgi:hypothetical protein
MKALILVMALGFTASAMADNLCGANEDEPNGTAAGAIDACNCLTGTCHKSVFDERWTTDPSKAKVVDPSAPAPSFDDSKTSA